MNPRLLITMILDNSAAFQGERFDKFKLAFENMLAKFNEANPKNIDLEIIAYDEFSPIVLKTFKEKEFKAKPLEPFKMPFLGKSIDQGIKDLKALCEYYDEKGVQMYKPWVFVITNAYSFDDLDKPVADMKAFFMSQKVLYMPFILSQRKIPQNVEALQKVKAFMRIKEGAYEEFFNWFFNMATKRANTDIETSVKFDRADFEEWAVL